MQTTIEEGIEVTVIITITIQEEDSQNVLYDTRLITYVLNVL